MGNVGAGLPSAGDGCATARRLRGVRGKAAYLRHGIWFDGNSNDGLIANNQVENNFSSGIRTEISRNVSIANNTVGTNAWGDATARATRDARRWGPVDKAVLEVIVAARSAGHPRHGLVVRELVERPIGPVVGNARAIRPVPGAIEPEGAEVTRRHRGIPEVGAGVDERRLARPSLDGVYPDMDSRGDGAKSSITGRSPSPRRPTLEMTRFACASGS